MHKISGDLASDIMFIHFRGYPESMCEDGRDAFYKLERYVLQKLEPYLDEEFKVEIEGYGIYKFQAYDWKGNSLNYASLNNIEHLKS